jgi:glycosyltransferase involved in cell wall biosynthesis
MKTHQLLVTIPNYNRREQLLATLSALRKQWTGQFSVLVLDDCSEDSIQSAIFNTFPDAPQWVRFIRHQNRVGLSANIVLCFYNADSEWMWLLGNDDELAENAVDVILNAMRDNPDACFINFASNLAARSETRTVKGLDGLLGQLDSHSNLNFISTGVYRVKHFKKYIATGYHYGYTFSPHLAMLFSLLRISPHQTVVLHCKEICKHRPARNSKEKWSRIDFCLGAAALLELEGLTFKQRRLLANSLATSGKVHEFIALQLLAECQGQPSGAVQKFILRAFVQRYFYFDRSVSRWIKKQVYPMMFWAPRFAWWLVGIVFFCTGRKQQLEVYQQAPRQGDWR